jgi:hypothetical protein
LAGKDSPNRIFCDFWQKKWRFVSKNELERGVFVVFLHWLPFYGQSVDLHIIRNSAE